MIRIAYTPHTEHLPAGVGILVVSAPLETAKPPPRRTELLHSSSTDFTPLGASYWTTVCGCRAGRRSSPKGLNGFKRRSDTKPPSKAIRQGRQVLRQVLCVLLIRWRGNGASCCPSSFHHALGLIATCATTRPVSFIFVVVPPIETSEGQQVIFKRGRKAHRDRNICHSQHQMPLVLHASVMSAVVHIPAMNDADKLRIHGMRGYWAPP